MRNNILFFILSSAILTLTGCGGESDPAPFDCATSDLNLSVAQVNDASCNANDGSVQVVASGGQGPYAYKLGDNTFQSSATFENMASGTYTITVKDSRDCENTVTADVLIENSTLVIDNISSTVAGCKDDQGQITIAVAGGSGTIQYKLNNGTFQTSNVFANITAGNHDIIVKDDSGCEVSGNVHVITGVSYENQVSSIITANCAISGCHNGSNSSIANWTNFSTVQSNASTIKSRTQSGAMPPAGSGKTLTQEQKDLIACWVDDGALDN